MSFAARVLARHTALCPIGDLFAWLAFGVSLSFRV